MRVFYKENQLMHLIVTFICKHTGNITAEDQKKNSTMLTKQIQERTLNPIKLSLTHTKFANLGFFFYIVFFLKEYCFMILAIQLFFCIS